MPLHGFGGGVQAALHCFVVCWQVPTHCINRLLSPGFEASLGSPAQVFMQSDACWLHFVSHGLSARATQATSESSTANERMLTSVDQREPPSGIDRVASHWRRHESSRCPSASRGAPAQVLRQPAFASLAGLSTGLAWLTTTSSNVTPKMIPRMRNQTQPAPLKF